LGFFFFNFFPFPHFNQYPSSCHYHVGFAPKNIKINTYKIEIDCECGKPNAIENMIGCEGIKGKNFAMYGSISLQTDLLTFFKSEVLVDV
jgi:hypothetical protein